MSAASWELPTCPIGRPFQPDGYSKWIVVPRARIFQGSYFKSNFESTMKDAAKQTRTSQKAPEVTAGRGNLPFHAERSPILKPTQFKPHDLHYMFHGSLFDFYMFLGRCAFVVSASAV